MRRPLARTKEPQYERCLEVDRRIGRASLGLMVNQVWHDDPRRVGFVLARHKFVAKMLVGQNAVADVGCADAFGTRIVAQTVGRVTGYDFDPTFIDDARSRSIDPAWPIAVQQHDILAAPLPERFDAVYSLDVIEHIAPRREHDFLENLRRSLLPGGVLILGTPSLESQAYASPSSRAGHVNCKTGDDLRSLLLRHFAQVFLFGMNDEVVHTGFLPMAHYLFALCVNPRA